LHSAAKSAKRLRRLTLWFALGMLATGVWFVARVPWVFIQEQLGMRMLHRQAGAWVSSEPSPIAIAQVITQQGLFPQVAGAMPSPKMGVLMGRVVVPNLQLSAPLVQGTGLGVLAMAAGHLTNSVLPGHIGTSIIAAHDVTYFHHLDNLKMGDEIDLTTSQGRFVYQVMSHRVVSVGTNVDNTSYPSLVLETCYPLNALTPVNQRYLVIATLVSSTVSSTVSSH